MTKKLLSIALPVRNGANFLAAALDSILAQSWTDFELFVSDNASDDATPDILAEYARRDSRVRASRSEVSLTQVENTNRAVGLTDTRWVKLFCHDDLMRADCMAQIAAVVREVEGTKVALIGNGERHLFDNGYLSDGDADGPVQMLSGHEALRKRCSRKAGEFVVPSITTATVRRDAFFQQGGFEGRFVYFEIFTWYQMLVDWDFAFVPGALTVNRIHGRQVAANARGSLRSARDNQLFFREFLAKHGSTLKLGPMARLYAWLIAPSRAASEVVTEFESGRAKRVPEMFRQMPATWWPLMPPLALRAWLAEKHRTAALRRHLPIDLIHPN